MTNPITSTECEAVIKISQKTKAWDQMASQENSIKHLRKSLMLILLKHFQKISEGGTIQTHSMRSPSPQYQNQTKTTHKKENYRPISLTNNIDVKILNKILANRIQQHIKKFIHHDQVAFIPGMQVFFNIHKSINVINNIDILNIKTI